MIITVVAVLLESCCSSGWHDSENPSVDSGPDAQDADLDSGSDADSGTDGDTELDAGDAEIDAEEPPLLECPTKGGDMVVIPPGPFLFGQAKTEVDIPHPYCIDVTEVTVAAWNACVADGECQGYDDWERCTELDPERSPNQCFPDRDDYPANFIDWFRADAFCRWAGKRLPFGAEWEKAARGTDGRTYPWGDEFHCRHAHVGRGTVFRECRGYLSLPNLPVAVGTYPSGVSPYGALDMVGNVKEWIEYRTDLSVPPPESEVGVSRGGDYSEGEWMVTAYSGYAMVGPGITTMGHGFRCAWGAYE